MSRSGTTRKPYERTRLRASDDVWVHDRAPGMPAAVLNTARRSRPSATNDNKLVVSNLHYNIMAKDLLEIFGQVGTLVDEPEIKYDRSGRSTGIALIHYETAAEAAKAKRAYDGKLAKGERMSIAFDTHSTAPTRRSASAPSSLADRIQKAPLLARLGDESSFKTKSNAGTKTNDSSGAGPTRSHAGRRRGGAPRPEKFKKQPKTQEDLDKELDAFMAADDSAAPAAVAVADVEMAT